MNNLPTVAKQQHLYRDLSLNININGCYVISTACCCRRLVTVFGSRSRVQARTPVLVMQRQWSSLKTGPARPRHVKIALDITAVDIDLYFLYSTGTMIMYDSYSL